MALPLAPKIPVVGAAIVRPQDGWVLVARRSEVMASAGLWEFPGGKVEPGESPRQALRREITEELGVTVAVGRELVPAAPAPADSPIALRVFCCELLDGTPRAREHAELSWVAPRHLAALDWAAPDVPFVAALATTPGLPPRRLPL